MVAFHRNRGMALRPVHRIKHVVDLQNGVAANTLESQNLILTVDAPILANDEEVETGSKVNGIYINVEAYATSAAALSNIYFAVAKNPGGNLTFPNPNNVGSNDNKRYFIHQEMKMVEQKVNGNPRTIFNGVVVIPRGYKRFGPNDSLVILLFAPGISFNYCLQTHYKEFR